MSENMPPTDVRSAFIRGANGFLELVRKIPHDSWESHALGIWTIRDLVGHASRAISTVEDYLARENSGPVIDDPVEYFLHALAGMSDPDRKRDQDAAIAARGIEAGHMLGNDPAASIAALVTRVAGKVQTTDGAALLGTPIGPMPLSAYLPTRTFELAVHGCDLARALSIPPPEQLRDGIASACELAGRIAARREHAADLLLLITGRVGLPEGTTIL